MMVIQLQVDVEQQNLELARKLLHLIYDGYNQHKNLRNKTLQENNSIIFKEYLGSGVIPEEYLQTQGLPKIAGHSPVIYPMMNLLDPQTFSLIGHIIEAYNKPFLKVLLAHDRNLANYYLENEVHPLYRAIALGSEEMVAELLKAGVNLKLNVVKLDQTSLPFMLFTQGNNMQLNPVLYDAIIHPKSNLKIDAANKSKILKQWKAYQSIENIETHRIVDNLDRDPSDDLGSTDHGALLMAAKRGSGK